jgi:hypothetical protein
VDGVIEHRTSHRHAVDAAVAERKPPAREDPRCIAQVIAGRTPALLELPAKPRQELLERCETAREQPVSVHSLGDASTGRRRVGELSALDQHYFIAYLSEHQARQEPTDAATDYDRYVCHRGSVATR